jgi:hypothetical protein
MTKTRSTTVLAGAFALCMAFVVAHGCASTPKDSGDPGIVPDPGGNGTLATDCTSPNLVWRTARKTNYTSYPDPGSTECIQYSGCMYAGMFSACPGTKSRAWVMAHNIVAVFPDLPTLRLHDLCLRSGSNTLVVTVYDECADSDCSGCCTQNKGSAEELIDIESYTDTRWGVSDGRIEWADLGPTKTAGCN